tara:strand:- start:157 stop:606 length:450 start_codon:yes stop_codon:yes gene_type:complete
VGGLFGEGSGDLNWSLRMFNQRKNETSNTGFDFTDDTGQWNEPDWTANLQVSYALDDLFAFVDFNYTGETDRNVEQTEPLQYIDQNGNPYTKVPSLMTVDIGATYQLTESLLIRASVQNATDWYPDPIEISIGRYTYGRTYNMGVTASF